MADVRTDVILGSAQEGEIAAAAVGRSYIALVLRVSVGNRQVPVPDSAREAVSRGPEIRMHRRVLRSTRGEEHEVGARMRDGRVERGTKSAEGCVPQTQNRTRKRSTIGIGGIEPLTGEIDDAGTGHRSDITLHGGLRTAPGRCRRRASCRGWICG